MSEAVAVARIPAPLAVAGVSAELLGQQEAFRLELEANLGQIMAVLPKGVSGVALATASMTAALDNPQLMDCTPLSMMRAVLKVATLGLRIGETCDLVPVKGKVECWIRVKGVVDLAVRARSIVWARDGFVCDGDRFEYEERETGTHFVHQPKSFPKQDGSNVTHIYASILLPDKTRVFEVWPMERCLAHMKRYAPNPKPGSAWAQHRLQMMSKSVLKAGLRFARLSPEIEQAMSAGDDIGDGSFEVVGDPMQALSAAGPALAAMAQLDAPTMTLEMAEAMLLPGEPKAWGGKGGQPLGSLKDSLLARVVSWAEADEEKAARFAETVKAARMILASRAEPVDDAEPDYETEDAAA